MWELVLVVCCVEMKMVITTWFLVGDRGDQSFLEFESGPKIWSLIATNLT